MKEWFEQLSASERRTLIAGAAVLTLLLLYTFLWRPIHKGVEETRARVESQRALLAWMQSAAVEAKSLMSSSSGAKPSRGGQSLLSIVDQTARREKLATALKRVEPKGTDEVRVRLEDAVFDDTVAWLTRLQASYGVDVDSVSLERVGSGRVNASITLKEGGA